MDKKNYFTPSQSYCCMQNRFTLFTSLPSKQHGSIQESKQVSSKILPPVLYNNFASSTKIGREMSNTILSKPTTNLEANKYEHYKDASEVTRKRAVLTHVQNRQSVKPEKEIPSKYVEQTIRKIRNRGYTVPKKVQNRPNLY